MFRSSVCIVPASLLYVLLVNNDEIGVDPDSRKVPTLLPHIYTLVMLIFWNKIVVSFP